MTTGVHDQGESPHLIPTGNCDRRDSTLRAPILKAVVLTTAGGSHICSFRSPLIITRRSPRHGGGRFLRTGCGVLRSPA
jgi:hypothetical protein